ncbi:DUF11 domain-containing protein [Massilia forsythiae]|uniref:DUF11 domain-containing protein n=1 Tax=Massilia forsythiae TaxID=2728020 RepID=A0A7Z2VZU6_9BURK|nr:DUF11 domain-containing protein [Massilia forsythiae]QJE01912.1 DUF11 domain-containing protein [Massilia forsythiae]
MKPTTSRAARARSCPPPVPPLSPPARPLPTRSLPALLAQRRRLGWTVLALGALLVLLALLAVPARAACVSGACVSAGPRLASVSTTQGALLNPLLGGLLGTSLNLSVADWNAVAQGDVRLLDFLTALQASTGVSTPSQALSAGATLAQVSAALQAAARAQAKTSLAGALANLQSQLGGAAATVRVGDLLKVSVDSGALAGSTINALDMLSGLVQLYNTRNVLTTPAPVGISGGALGMAGVINAVQLYAQAIEPPVYVCGPNGTSFHSAAIRVHLKLDLVTLSPATSALTVLPGVRSASIAISQLDLYLEVARAEGSLGAVDAVGKAVTVQAAPGVADGYLGSIDDSVFFNRSRVLNAATDLGYGKIGSLVLNGSTFALEVKSSARGDAPFATSLNFSGSFPQTRTVRSSTTFATNLAGSLVNNLALRTTPSLGLLDSVVSPVLKTVVTGAVGPVVAPILGGVADPLLQLLGIGLGQMTVTVNGICQACDDFKLTKAVDRTDATPGSTITYTITYQNSGTTNLTDLKVTDATPAFTVYTAGGCGALGSGLSSCAVAAQPAAGGAGALEWRFGGTLQPGGMGSVSFTVVVQ